jgi:tripartite-type tricarboxylate transporter receptor subunit TctC
VRSTLTTGKRQAQVREILAAADPIDDAAVLPLGAGGKEITVSSAQFDNQLKLLSLALGVPVLAVPYKGGAEAITAAISGQVTGVLTAVPAMMGQIKGGKLRAVGESSARRSKALPDVPTFAEQGYPRFTVSAWLSVLAPKGTPDAVVQRLAEATQAIVTDPAFEQRMAALGAEPLHGGPADTAARMKAEVELWRAFAP